VEWCARFPNVKVHNGDPRHSDHRLVIVSPEDERTDHGNQGCSCFRFEADWLQEENCETIVEKARRLSMNVRSGSVAAAVYDVSADLWDWSKIILGDLENRIKHVKRPWKCAGGGELHRIVWLKKRSLSANLRN
jgi:hypothetical protein